MKTLMISFLLLVLFNPLYSQDIEGLRKVISDMLEQLAEQQQVDFDYEEMLNDLIDLNQNPINLNTAGKEDLEQLFFLSDFQIENILFYQYNNGPFYSVYELQAIEDLDWQTIQFMLPFVKVGQRAAMKYKYTNGRLLARVQSVLQTPMGYRYLNDSTPPKYAGSKVRWLTKARVDINGKIEAGMTLEKDPGEVAFPHTVPLADFSSAFIQFNQFAKGFDKLIIGDYRLSFGQGLGLWTDMAFSKSTDTKQLRRRARTLNNYTSVNESSFLRGVAFEYNWKNIGITPFYSNKKIDAGLISDSLLQNHFVSSIQETGYHRTRSEIDNRHRIRETIWGGRVIYNHHLFRVEGGYVNWRINRPVMAKTHLKDFYRFSGSNQETLWLSPSVFWGRIIFFGEVAIQDYKHWGLYQGLTFKAGNDVIASLAYRQYSNAYSPLLANPFSESSLPGGESGVYASVQFKPFRKVTVKAFADMFKYSWLRYNVYAPSSGFEYFAQLDYAIDIKSSIYLRYKYSEKEINRSINAEVYKLGMYSKQNIRLFYVYRMNENWRFQTQVEQSFFKHESISTGWLAFQDLIFSSQKQLHFSLRYVFFDMDDYNSRIYSFEPDVLYAFNVPAYFEQGSKLILNASYSPVRNLRIWLRLAHTSYSGVESISSGNQLIPGNIYSDIKVQVQFRF